jgi:hypothetical protein
MTSSPYLIAGGLLATLQAMNVEVEVRGDQLALHPRGRLTAKLVETLKTHKADLLTLLTEPRRRWRVQAEALVGSVAQPAQCDDLLELFDEREAIASVDGASGDDAAGRMAYEHLLEHVRQGE